MIFHKHYNGAFKKNISEHNMEIQFAEIMFEQLKE